jgi:hypothetical protein
VGRLDRYAKEIFDTETPVVTRGAAVWLPPSEIGLTEVRLDGRILVRDPAELADFPPPWADAVVCDEIVFEAKMQGDHVDLHASERACLRRQARQVQRMEDPQVPWDGDLPLWLLAAHVPASLRRRRTLRKIGDGCYRVETGSFPYLWIAANELPLCEELIPFLIARTGTAFDELALPSGVSRMVDFLPMSTAVLDELLRFASEKPEDDRMRARQEQNTRIMLEMTPTVRDEVVAREARSVLRRVLSRRKLTLATEDEARIDACTDPATLERWIEQAVDAPTAAEALR